MMSAIDRISPFCENAGDMAIPCVIHGSFRKHLPEMRETMRLFGEAAPFAWLPARDALRDLDMGPNARHTLELYAGTVGVGATSRLG
jgi:hypothetical protein